MFSLQEKIVAKVKKANSGIDENKRQGRGIKLFG